MTEIERKFLVKYLPDLNQYKSKRIVQGFLNSDPERTVRVRLMGEKAFLTIKGIGNSSGVSRFEWEHEIYSNDAADLLKIAEPGVIAKTRYFIPNGNHTIELDVFEDDNAGLIIAEIELQNENEQFIIPDWMGIEVTGEKRYYNSALAKNPWKGWHGLE